MHKAADHAEASRKHVVAGDLRVRGDNDNAQMSLEWCCRNFNQECRNMPFMTKIHIL